MSSASMTITLSKSAAKARSRAEEIARYELTPAQQDVFELLLGGLTTNEIGEQLELSPFTVSNHLRAVFAAFGVHSRAAVIAHFIVPPDLEVPDLEEAS